MFNLFSLLDDGGVCVAHDEVEAGKLLGLFCCINLGSVGALPTTSLYSIQAVSSYAKGCYVVGGILKINASLNTIDNILLGDRHDSCRPPTTARS